MSSDSKTINAPPSVVKKKAERVTTFIFGIDFFLRPDITELMRLCGPESVTFFLRIASSLLSDTKHTIKQSHLVTLGRAINLGDEAIERILEALESEDVDLLYEDQGLFRSVFVDEIVGATEVRRDAWREAKRQKRQTQISKPSTPVFENQKDSFDVQKSESVSSLHLTPLHFTSNQLTPIQITSDPPPHPPPEIPPDLLEFWSDATGALVDDAHPALVESGVFASTGRKPMKKYPELWISPVELAEVFKLYHDSGVPPDKFGLAFKPVVARLRTHKANGSRTDKVAAVNWLTSWALDQALTTLKKSKDLERSETYLEQSQRQR